MKHPLYELHNIAELDSACAYPGPLVRRIPRALAESLTNGSLVTENAVLTEIRFVKESGHRLAVCLTSIDGADVFVYRGDFLFTHIRPPAGVVHRFILDEEFSLFKQVRPEAFAGACFAPQVWRVCFDGVVLFHGIDTLGSTLRPPLPTEKPTRRWLAHGSSITEGYTPVTRRQCYLAQTARRLGIDVINLGLSGSCRVEKPMAEYIASRDDWDIATFEFGVNVRALYKPDEFDTRVRDFLRIVTAGKPGKPIALLTIFPNSADWLINPSEESRRNEAFNTSIRAAARDYADKNVHLLEGADILSAFSGLTCDLVHPSTEGHSLMAENLARRLQPLLPV